MGFSFKERIKEVKEVKKEQGRPRNLSESVKPLDDTIISLVSPPQSTNYSPTESGTDRPLSSHGIFTLSKSKGLKKKRSLASLLSAASESNIITTPVTQSLSLGSSPLGILAPITASPVDEQPNNGPDETWKPARRPINNFIRKNTWLKRENMKVHPYPLEAPYMQAYDPILLENERYTNDLLRRLNSNEAPSFHDYGNKTPLYILDLGCGSGHWLLDVSLIWKNSQHTGFDLVDTLIPDLRKQDNIQFVRGNFLNPLPFADKSFDFVRMANLTLCIPYNKWEFVLSEVQRILTIDGRLELIDDQIFFPYGPPPVAFPTYPSTPSPVAPMKPDSESSFFDLDGDDFDDEGTIGGDSMEDGDSMSTESTLFSDGDTSASSHEIKIAPIKDTSSEPRLPLPNPPAALSLDDPKTPTSTTTITIDDASTTARPSSWSIEAAAARDMEIVFENMLNKKFGIHTRPSDFVVDVMKHVFGNGRKIKSCHLKLAPNDTIIGALSKNATSNNGNSGSTAVVGEKDEKITGDSVVGQMLNEVKPWFSVDKVKDERKRHKMVKKMKKMEGLVPSSPRSSDESFTPSTHVPPGISAKAAGRLGITEDSSQYASSPITGKVSAKAANRLGINEESRQYQSGQPSSTSADDLSITGAEREPTKIPPLAELSVDTGTSTTGASPANENRLSAKAAGRLGISYSELAAAAAGSTRRPQSSSSSFSTKSFNAVQSPGLVLWPNLYIPLPPVELEMHACKHVHTLLGCKPALAEFVKTHVDEQGERLAKDDEFDQALWDYECFRRRRFHWPSEAPDWDIASTDPSEEFSPRSAKFPTPRTVVSPDPTAPRKISESSHGPYMCDELTHVRTVRVYEAVKTDDYSLSSLPFPRSPAPSPPTIQA
ncbi:hypothetical protein BDZ94DRAFT_1231356 [Collybia nuda]|uniref:Methyltransferase domain-containing protein n=1 Tax=Collybia nuda TaxID=64659 RepID=A0A9P5YH02_9AGAR|nr:hypothetical protein BDZ94DRAFT_1231356 [Collybia nuda]